MPDKATPPPRMTSEGYVAHERKTDTDSWARLTGTLERYKVFWLMAFALGGWFGTRITEPLGSVPVMQKQQALIIARLDTADADRKDMTRVLKVFAKVICAGLTPADRYKYDIDCRELPPPERVVRPGGL